MVEVSTIIPAYNVERCIRRAIDSVLSQTFTNYEIIVVDDGSTDQTADIVKTYGDKVRYIYQDNAGVSSARNTGISQARGRWIAFLDADDEWMPDKLESQISLLQNNPNLKWCSTNLLKKLGNQVTTTISISAIKSALEDRGYIDNYFIEAARGRCFIGTPTAVIVEKELFEKLGDFEVGRVSGEDLDMWWRIAYDYKQVGFIPEPKVTMHLDIQDAKSTKRRLSTKNSVNARELIAKHLKLAEQKGCLESFAPYAMTILYKSILIAVYNGFKYEPRQTIRLFPDFFPWYWRFGTYILTIFPGVTSGILKFLVYFRYRLGLERQVSRRWTYRSSS